MAYTVPGKQRTYASGTTYPATVPPPASFSSTYAQNVVPQHNLRAEQGFSTTSFGGGPNTPSGVAVVPNTQDAATNVRPLFGAAGTIPEPSFIPPGPGFENFPTPAAHHPAPSFGGKLHQHINQAVYATSGQRPGFKQVHGKGFATHTAKSMDEAKAIQAQVDASLGTNTGFMTEIIPGKVHKDGRQDFNVHVKRKDYYDQPPPPGPGSVAPGTDPNQVGGNPLNNMLTGYNAYNQGITNFLNSLTPTITQAEKGQAGVLGTAQEAEQKQIPLVQSMSPEQNAEINAQQEAIARQGLEAIDRETGMNARQTVANLRNSGFGSSNLGDINYAEGVETPQRLMIRDLMDTLAKSRPETRALYQQGATQGLEALNRIQHPGFPANVPKPADIPQGTYRGVPSLGEVNQLMQLFDYLIPGQNQETKTKLIAEYLNSIGFGTTSTTPFGSIIGAAGNIFGSYLGRPGATNINLGGRV